MKSTDDGDADAAVRDIAATSVAEGSTKKRKADVLGRLLAGASSSSGGAHSSSVPPPPPSSSASGRGSRAGWTACPLCGTYSKKRFALGRGIAAHLHAVHTPWKPGAIEMKIRNRKRKRQEAEARRGERRRRTRAEYADTDASDRGDGTIEQERRNKCGDTKTPSVGTRMTWEPTQEEIDGWDSKVLEIIRHLERQQESPLDTVGARIADSEEKEQGGGSSKGDSTAIAVVPIVAAVERVGPGHDRMGRETIRSYEQSLPPFLKAAANGELDQLRAMVDQVRYEQQKNLEHQSDRAASEAVLGLLDTRDRHLSIAEHWAAGGGHLDCLRYLVELRKSLITSPSVDSSQDTYISDGKCRKKKVRRRDGKTSLHYAARNGRLECIRYLIDEAGHEVDEVSGDGTTPLHLACFGGYVDAVLLLLDEYGAAFTCNDWGCSVAHWVAMTKCRSEADIRRMCTLAQNRGVSFVTPQKQGHTALHKAAQKLNRHVIEWMAEAATSAQRDTDDGTEKTAGTTSWAAAGRPDSGGHVPSEIWLGSGGDADFARWMRETMGW